MNAATVTMELDLSSFTAECDEIALLLSEAGDSAQTITEEFRGLVERGLLGDEIDLFAPVSAGPANQLVLAARFRPGGKVDGFRAALRALNRQGNV